jgi:hypothetical protein
LPFKVQFKISIGKKAEVEQIAAADLLAVMLFADNGAKRHASWRKPLSSTVLPTILIH